MYARAYWILVHKDKNDSDSKDKIFNLTILIVSYYFSNIFYISYI